MSIPSVKQEIPRWVTYETLNEKKAKSASR